MREIKFRAWDKEEKMMRYGGFVISPDGYGVMDDNDWVLMQFTGLHDRNGKEIYEGDIVVFRDNMSVKNPGVKYDSFSEVCFGEYCYGEYENAEGGYGWFLKPITDIDGHGLDESFANYHEIIGTVFENPELLTLTT